MRFEGTQAYVATEDLKVAVNAAITLERPLLVKGEPGTGKTVLALEIAKAIGAPLIEWHVKSTTKALQGLYEYDAVSRLRDSQLGDARVQDIRNYIKRGKLWDAFARERDATVGFRDSPVHREKLRSIRGQPGIVRPQPRGERIEGIVVAERRSLARELIEPLTIARGRELRTTAGEAEAF